MAKKSGQLFDYWNSEEGQASGWGALAGMLGGGALGATDALSPYVGDHPFPQNLVGNAGLMGLLGAGLGGLGGWGAQKLFGNNETAVQSPHESSEYDLLPDFIRDLPEDTTAAEIEELLTLHGY